MGMAIARGRPAPVRDDAPIRAATDLGPRATDAGSDFDRRTTIRGHSELAEQHPADGAGPDDGEARGRIGLQQNVNQDLDRDSHQESEDRAEYGRHGDN